MTRLYLTKKRLILLLMAFSSQESAAFSSLSPAVASQRTAFASKTLLHVRFRNKDDDDVSATKSGSSRRGRRLSFFSAFSKTKRLRAKQVRQMQASAAAEATLALPNGTDMSAWTSVGTKYEPIKKKKTTTETRPVLSYAPQVGSNGTVALPLSDTPPPPQALPNSHLKSAGALNRMTGQWFQSILLSIIHKRSVEPPSNLRIKAIPMGNVLGNLVKGRYRSNFELTFDSFRFPNIQMSGGGRIDAKRLALNVWSFTPSILRQGTYRFPMQFDFLARNCTFLERDLVESSCIRNGLARLLVRILKRAGNISTRGGVKITSIQVLPSNKISVLGHAKTRFGSSVVFEVRSGIDTACRGHVLTFPGLEVSLQPALGVFVPVVPGVTLDIGHNAQLSKLSINGKSRQVSLDAHVSITPQHTLKMSKRYTQSKEAYLAQYSFDVGQWLTHIGNFTL